MLQRVPADRRKVVPQVENKRRDPVESEYPGEELDRASVPRNSPMNLAEYTAAISSGWTRGEITRAILHDLPRRAAAMDASARERALNDRPGITATRWDALLAAMVEHVAGLHGHAVPEWVEERERFLDTPWVIPDSAPMRRDAVRFAPAAFIRHGALPDPKDLDARGGERHVWLP